MGTDCQHRALLTIPSAEQAMVLGGFILTPGERRDRHCCTPTPHLVPKAGAHHAVAALAQALGLSTLGWHPQPQGCSHPAGAAGLLWQRQMKASGAVTGVMDGLRALAGAAQTLRMWREPPRL